MVRVAGDLVFGRIMVPDDHGLTLCVVG